MEDTYEITMDVLVPTTIKVKAKNEDEAIEKAYERLEAKRIERDRISDMSWPKVIKEEEQPNASVSREP